MLVLIEQNIKESEELGEGDIVMEEYIEEAKKASQEPEILSSYDKEIAFKEKCYRDGYGDGISEGISQGIQQVAKSMLEENVDLKTIQEYTGLSLEELENLKTK